MTLQIQEAALHQINMRYVPVEDRLLLKLAINPTEELNVWLTQRIAKNLWLLLNNEQVVNAVAPNLSAPEVLQQTNSHNPVSPETQNLLHDFAKEAETQKLNFADKYEPRTALNKDILLLVRECQVTAPAQGHAYLELLCTNQQNVKLVLDSTLLLALVNILKLAMQQAEWHFAITNQPPLPNYHTPTTALH